jgi:uncharacterized protein (DUF488 family)
MRRNRQATDVTSQDGGPAVFTVGHSTHSADTFVETVRAHGVRQLADIRRFPGSRRHPHFGSAALADRLAREGMAYRHFPELGGRRPARPDSDNTAWRNAAFRGYADYMGTAEFERAVAELLDFVRADPTALMCAESLWWRCHRALLADALVARGVTVRHIMSAASAKLHVLNEFARIEGTRVRYPGLV